MNAGYDVPLPESPSFGDSPTQRHVPPCRVSFLNVHLEPSHSRTPVRGNQGAGRMTKESEIDTKSCVNLWLITGGYRILCHPLAKASVFKQVYRVINYDATINVLSIHLTDDTHTKAMPCPINMYPSLFCNCIEQNCSFFILV